MPNPCHWTALKRNSQKSKWINQAPIPKRTHEKEKKKKMMISNSLEDE